MSVQDENLQTGRAAVGGIPDTLRNQLHEIEALCAELEELPSRVVGDYPAELARLRAAYDGRPEVPPEYAEILEKRFAAAWEAAERAAAENEARLQLRAARTQECAKLSAELDALLAGAELVTFGEVEALEKRWNETLAQADPDSVDAAGFEARLAPLRERLRAEAEVEQQRAEAAGRLAAELAALTASGDINQLRERKSAIETEYAALGKVPKAAADKYNAAHRAAGAKLAQHYETLDLARWESYTLKLDLCAELEKLSALSDEELPRAAKALHELREKWKALGGVPKAKNEEINTRYLELTRALQHRVDEFFARRRQEQKQAAARKQELVEKAAAMAGSTEWNSSAAAFKALQAEWKTIPGAGPAEKTLFAAFRAAADQFFNARSKWFDERNSRFEAAAEVKRKLIAEAEALTGNPSGEAVRRAKALRGEYIAAGPAGRNEAELSAKFNAALDKFFGGRREAFAEREAKSRSLIAELEALAADPGEPGHAEARARAIRGELRELACRNTFELERRTFERFEKALAAARGRVLTDKLALVKSVARPLAAAFDALKRGDAVEEAALQIENLERFPKLHSAAALIRSAAGGDAKAAEKLDRAVAAARVEHDRICAALEKLVGVEDGSTAMKPEVSLADELQAAIAGNFMRSDAKAVEKSVDPKQLLAEYLNAGLLGERELEASFERFDRAYGKLR